jgi:hypothetical protein
MPRFYFNVRTNRTGPEVEEDLKRFGKIRSKIEDLGLYLLVCNVSAGSKVKENYEKLLSELSKQPYISRLEESAKIELLND